MLQLRALVSHSVKSCSFGQETMLLCKYIPKRNLNICNLIYTSEITFLDRKECVSCVMYRSLTGDPEPECGGGAVPGSAEHLHRQHGAGVPGAGLGRHPLVLQLGGAGHCHSRDRQGLQGGFHSSIFYYLLTIYHI